MKIAIAAIFFSVVSLWGKMTQAAAPSNAVYPRIEFSSLMGGKAYSRHRDLLVLALTKLMKMDPDDPFSFYQVSSDEADALWLIDENASRESAFANVDMRLSQACSSGSSRGGKGEGEWS